VLAAVFRVSGADPLNGTLPDPFVVRVVLAAIGGVTVGLSAWLALLVGGRGAMIAVALWAPFHFGHLVLSTVPGNEAVYGALVVATLVAGLGLARGSGDGSGKAGLALRAGMLGVLSALTALVRAEFLAGVVLLAIWVFRQSGNSLPGRAIPVLAFLSGASIGLVPDALANWRSIDAFNREHAATLPGPLPRLALVTSYGAFNFAMANHARADGGPNNDHPLLQPGTAEEEARLAAGSLDLSVRAVHRMYVDGYRLGAAWIVEHPADALTLAARKALMASGALAFGVSFDNLPEGPTGTRRRVDIVDPDGRVMWVVGLVLLAAGIALLRGHRLFGLLLVPVATLALSTLGFFGYARLGVAYLPLLWVFQAAAVVRLAAHVPWPRFAARWPEPTAFATLVVLALLAAGSALLPRRAVLEGPRGADGAVIEDETVRVIAGLGT